MRPDVLIIARSGRQLATAAARAGYAPAVIDCFGDADTRAASAFTLQLPARPDFSFDAANLLDRVHGVFATYGTLPVVYGSGFEAQPHLLRALEAFAPVSGCRAAAVSRCKDPVRLTGLLTKAGITAAGYTYRLAGASRRYLRKRRGGCGGDHITHARPAAVPGQRDYFQPFHDGEAVSVAFVTGAGRVEVLGVCETLQIAATQDPGFAYAGSVTSPERYDRSRGIVDRLVSDVARIFDLRGLCGIDFVVTPDGQWCVLEINPRPPASFDLLAAASEVFRAHLGARKPPCRPVRPYGDVRASGLCMATQSFTVSNGLDLPSWCADRPCPGTRIAAGMPVCTVYATRAGDAPATRALLRQRLDEVNDRIADDRRVGAGAVSRVRER